MTVLERFYNKLNVTFFANYFQMLTSVLSVYILAHVLGLLVVHLPVSTMMGVSLVAAQLASTCILMELHALVCQLLINVQYLLF